MIGNRISRRRKHIIVIGGGFAGLNFVKQMFNSKFFKVTLVDRNNYNYFTPLLYQVATSFLEPSSISYPFRRFLKNKRVTFRNASLTSVDSANNRIHLSDGEDLAYDYLVFAAGTKTNFFGNEGIRKNAFHLKGIDDALIMRNEMIKNLERASIERNPLTRQKLLTIVIAGGGPTGVELAGMFAEMKKHIVGMDYPELRDAAIDIHLIDTAPQLLSSMSSKTHSDVYSELKQLGVRVRLNTIVTRFEGDRVHLSNGAQIHTGMLIWCAGVIANTFDGISTKSLGKGDRMITNEYHMVQGYNNIFAVGDIAIQFHDQEYPLGLPQVAQPAIQHGKSLARNLLSIAQGKPMKPFKYFDKGQMAIVGRGFAVADLFKHKVHLRGTIGLLSWLFIHLFSLVNYNNIIKTFYNWIIAYITCDQVLRMIFLSDSGLDKRREAADEPGQTKTNNSYHRDYAEQV